MTSDFPSSTSFSSKVTVLADTSRSERCCFPNLSTRKRNIVVVCLLFLILTTTSYLTSQHLNIREAVYAYKLFQLKPDVRPVCSFSVLQAAVDNVTGYLPANGTWLRNSWGAPVQFQPTICRYDLATVWPANILKMCLTGTRITNIVVMGDSNAGRQFAALVNLLGATDYSCQVVGIENATYHQVDASFYKYDGLNVSAIKVHDRDCSGCHSQHVTCHSRDYHHTVVQVKFLVLEMLHDSEVTSARSMTSQEFLFKEYLRAPGNVPDLVIIFGNNHDNSHEGTLVDFRRSMRYLLDLTHDYLPPTAQLIWLSKPQQYLPGTPILWRNAVYEGKFDTNEWLTRANQIFYQEIKERFDRTSKPFAFLDLFELESAVLAELSTDGVHSKPIWYDFVISYIFQTFCAEYIK